MKQSNRKYPGPPHQGWYQLEPKPKYKFFMCVCEHEGVTLEHDPGWGRYNTEGRVTKKEADEVYLSMYRYGSYGAAMPLKYRLKAAWDVLLHGHLNNDCIILKGEEWETFVDQVNHINSNYEHEWEEVNGTES